MSAQTWRGVAIGWEAAFLVDSVLNNSPWFACGHIALLCFLLSRASLPPEAPR